MVPGRWVDAGDLRPGDVVLLHPDRPAAVETVEYRPVCATVYNFEVDGLHNYAVGADRVLVHNATPCQAAAKYSKGLVEEAKKVYPKLAAKTQQHHVTPLYLGGARNGPKVTVNAAYHQQITNAFRKEWAYGTGRKPTAAQLQAIKDRVYSRFPLS